MKITKTIEEGNVIIKLSLTDEERKEMGYIRLSGPGFSAEFDDMYFLRATKASYAGQVIDLIDMTPGSSWKTSDDLLKTALENYTICLKLKEDAHSRCGKAEIISRLSAIEFLSSEDRIYYRKANGQIAKLD